MPDKSPDLKELKAIVDWISVTDNISQFSLKFADVEIFLSREQRGDSPPIHQIAAIPPSAPAPVAQPAPDTNPMPQAAKQAVKDALADDEVIVKAPMVGVFYAKPKPGAEDFVAVGDKVGADTVVCIVEVMKLMTNIEAGVSGTVTRILVENEQAVEFGQSLMVIKRDA